VWASAALWSVRSARKTTGEDCDSRVVHSVVWWKKGGGGGGGGASVQGDTVCREAKERGNDAIGRPVHMMWMEE
jgi:hypothetical protein